MARQKLTEFQAKEILSSKIKFRFNSFLADKGTTAIEIEKKFKTKALVVKVDQGVKKRGKRGLMKVKVTSRECTSFIRRVSRKGYSNFIIEEFIPHEQDDEQYMSMERVREGVKILMSPKGGVDVEDSMNLIKEYVIDYKLLASDSKLRKKLDELFADKVKASLLFDLIQVFEEYYFSFLEINPIVFKDAQIYLLDLAVEIDDAALNLIPTPVEIVEEANVSEAEIEVKRLDQNTPASLKLKIINPNGSLWMLLSGGGASLVLADEVADLGLGKDLGNYGEYSGNPTREDTYLYAKIIIDEMLKASSKKKVLIIGGGVANFTDVAKTFAGIIDALDEKSADLKKQKIKVFVRRGGPNQEEGLSLMEDFLKENDLFGFVSGPDLVLTGIIQKAIKKA